MGWWRGEEVFLHSLGEHTSRFSLVRVASIMKETLMICLFLGIQLASCFHYYYTSGAPTGFGDVGVTPSRRARRTESRVFFVFFFFVVVSFCSSRLSSLLVCFFVASSQSTVVAGVRVEACYQMLQSLVLSFVCTLRRCINVYLSRVSFSSVLLVGFVMKFSAQSRIQFAVARRAARPTDSNIPVHGHEDRGRCDAGLVRRYVRTGHASQDDCGSARRVSKS